jgi:hypothetical protein
MEFIYKCFCIKTLNKVIVEELTESYEMNQDNQDEILLNHLFPYKDRHPVAGGYYNDIKKHSKFRTPSMIIESEKAYDWLIMFHGKK